MLFTKVKLEKIVGQAGGPQDLKLALLTEGPLTTHQPHLSVSVSPTKDGSPAHAFTEGDELLLTLTASPPAGEASIPMTSDDVAN